MPIQVFVDDSGNKGQSRHFALVGLIGHSDHWAVFNEEWRACLDEAPRIPLFKMREAAARSGAFRGFSLDQRDNRLGALARIINRAAQITTTSIIDHEAHSRTWASMPKPHSEVYFWPFQNIIQATCHTLWDAGWREPFEVIYDEQVIFGPRALHWYPVVKRLFELQFPEQSALLPASPEFKKDDDALPIQAADMFAWCHRKATDEQGAIEFEWLLREMPNVKETDYSQYYDFERMQAVKKESERIAREGHAHAEEIARLYAQTKAQMK